MELPKIIARRWAVTLMGVLITTGLCLILVWSVPISYSARTSIVLLPPVTVVADGGNPYLYLGGLGQALDVLTRKLNADEFRAPIEETKSGMTYSAYADTTTSGPILIIEGTGPTAAAALDEMNAAVSAVPSALEDLQGSLSIPDKARITLAAVAVDTKPKADLKNRIQAVGAVGALGIVLTLMAAAYRDGVLATRRARALEADANPPASGAEPHREPESQPAVLGR
ncbi:hypothetical protein [Cryobacterium roopkundense]|nr:hypothetical protein [Cryobacterium roopkundense]MBB5642773.1 hypothetical protein [Cryobacterium roopkundense]